MIVHPLSSSYRSELVRVFRPSLRWLGLGLGALFAFLITAVVFMTAEPGGAVSDDPVGTGSFATIQTLEEAGGFFGGFELLGRILGLVLLTVWALSVAGDYSSGFIRMLVQAQPRRPWLMVGKIVALAGLTAAITVLSTAVTMVAAWLLAGPSDVSTAAWTDGLAGEVVAGAVNLTVACLAWGVVGLVIGTATRSAGIAIGAGVGWLLVLEPILGLLSDDLADYLPGGTISAVATGGTDSLSWTTALIVTTGYAVAAAVASVVLLTKRDIVA